MYEVVKPGDPAHPIRPIVDFGHRLARDFVDDVLRIEGIPWNFPSQFVLMNVPARMAQQILVVLLK